MTDHLAVANRMKIWAENHPWVDLQGLDDEEWAALAWAALGLPGWDAKDDE
jgi:hypothetical protein